MYAIESRWPSWSRWKRVTTRPHDERNPYDPVTLELRFDTLKEAEKYCEQSSRANSGENRIVKIA
jgi:hypothetical protein